MSDLMKTRVQGEPRGFRTKRVDKRSMKTGTRRIDKQSMKTGTRRVDRRSTKTRTRRVDRRSTKTRTGRVDNKSTELGTEGSADGQLRGRLEWQGRESDGLQGSQRNG